MNNIDDPAKVSLAEIAETQSVDIHEFRPVCDMWLYLMYLGHIP